MFGRKISKRLKRAEDKAEIMIDLLDALESMTNALMGIEAKFKKAEMKIYELEDRIKVIECQISA